MPSINSLSIDEFTNFVGDVGFYVDKSNEYLGYLRVGFNNESHTDQRLYIFEYDRNKEALIYLSLVLLQWFEGNTDRVIFVENSVSYFTYEDIYLLARKGIGEERDLLNAPAIKFSYNDWHFDDVTKLDIEDQKFIMQSAGFVALTLLSMCDACLLSNNSLDNVVISEGKLYFYSHSEDRLENIRKTLEYFL